jgi:hypothetical protein
MVLGMNAAPAGAGTLEWDKERFPGAADVGKYFRDTAITALGPMAMAIDGTMYAYATGIGMMKSTDSGRGWTKQGLWGGGAVVDFAMSTEDADALWVANVNGVYRSTNAGISYTLLTQTCDDGTVLGTNRTITDLAVGYTGNAPYLFIATQDGAGIPEIFVLGSSYGTIWTGMGTGFAAAADAIYDIACAPDFNTYADPLVVAVVHDSTEATGAATEVWYKYGGGTWSDPTSASYPTPTASGSRALFAGTTDNADIAFPDDFGSSQAGGSMEFFVGIDDTTAATNGGVFRIIANSSFIATTAKFDVATLDAAGNVGSASIMAGTTGGSVKYSTDGTADRFAPPSEGPSGTGYCYVALAQDFLDSEEAFALVTGGEMGLSKTVNGGRTWNQISLIDTDVTSVDSLSFGGSDRFMATSATAGNDSLWKYDGTYWERVTNNTNIDMVQASPEYESDSTVFYADATALRIYRSTDGGDYYKTQPTPPAGLAGLLVIDDRTLIVGDSAKTYLTSNNGTTWSPKAAGLATAGNIVNFALSPDYESDSTILCGDDAGKVFMSSNSGSSYSALAAGGFAGTGTTYVAFDADFANNSYVYAASTDGVTADLCVERYKDGDEWRSIYSDTAISTTFDSGGATGIATSPDGSLYLTDATALGVLRCLNPTSPVPEFENVTKDCTVQLNGLMVTAGSNKLWGINGADVWTYVDTLLATVSLSSPSDGSETGRVDSATLSWDALAGGRQYEIKVNSSPDFRGVDYSPANSSLTSIVVTGLEDGKTYYWKVRVARGMPVLSRWSRTWSFSTALGAPQWNPFVGGVPESPYNGATNVSRTPSFAWNPADWATGYEFVLAKDAAFTDTVVSKTAANALSNTVYLCEETLAYSTTYYWKVRAISKTTNSEWANAVFTTEGEAPPPPTSPTTTPPVEEEEEPLIAPAYLWAIIGIGAILVIALIILIVRTRRVA